MNNLLTSGLFIGRVFHKRLAPKTHVLNYKIFHILFDLDHLSETLQTTKLLSLNRFNLLSFYESDHGPDQQTAHIGTLKQRLIDILSAKALYQPTDRLFLMTMPRLFGFVFNPISLYFVQKNDGELRAVIYEVNNTFGDRYSYVLDVPDTTKGATYILQSHDKRLHVSPFMDMDMGYDFKLNLPLDRFCLLIDLKKHDQLIMSAGFDARREALTDKALWRQLINLPFMTLGVVLAIHKEALFIWLKGIKLRPKPATLKSSVN